MSLKSAWRESTILVKAQFYTITFLIVSIIIVFYYFNYKLDLKDKAMYKHLEEASKVLADSLELSLGKQVKEATSILLQSKQIRKKVNNNVTKFKKDEETINNSTITDAERNAFLTGE